jgi:hypothetical protein
MRSEYEYQLACNSGMREARRSQSCHADSLYLLASLPIKEGRLGHGALAIKPNYAEAHNNLGNAHVSGQARRRHATVWGARCGKTARRVLLGDKLAR